MNYQCNQSVSKRPALIAGIGETGISAIQLLLKNGEHVKCSTVDGLSPRLEKFLKKHKIPFESGFHSASFVIKSSIIIPSPGIKPGSPIFSYAKKYNISIVPEIDLAAKCNRAPWVGVTGSAGKTTTSTLIYRMLSKKYRTHLCGNIGQSFSRSILKYPHIEKRIVELSSFQLKFSSYAKPKIGVLTNIYPNHLDWHPSFSDYMSSKLRMFELMNSHSAAILNADIPSIGRISNKWKCKKVFFGFSAIANGIWSDGEFVYKVTNKRKKIICKIPKRFKGLKPMITNIMAATAVALREGISNNDIASVCQGFKNLKFRFELIGVRNGIVYINDSKSTTPQSTLSYVNNNSSHIVLIVGGKPKSNDCISALKTLSKRVSGIVVYGELSDQALLASRIRSNVYVRKNFKSALEFARRKAIQGQTILLSPMCASFDQFSSYRERGQYFEDWAKGRGCES